MHNVCLRVGKYSNIGSIFCVLSYLSSSYLFDSNTSVFLEQISSYNLCFSQQELKGHNLHTTLNVTPPCLGPPIALTAPPSSQLTSNAQIPVQSGTPYILPLS